MLRAFSLFLFLALVCGLGFWWIQRVPAMERSVPFDHAALFEWPCYGEPTAQASFSHDLTVLFYISELSCTTCTSRELKRMTHLYETYGDRVDFCLVVQGQEDMYLNNLRRLGKVSFPIVLEPARGELGLPDSAIILASKKGGKMLAHWVPSPNPDPSEKAARQFHDILERATHAASS